MPTFHPLSASIRLVTRPLPPTTSDGGLTRQQANSREETDRIEGLFKDGEKLSETHIPWLGGSTRLEFLDEVPFYLVQAGAGHFVSTPPTIFDRARALIERRQNRATETAGQTRPGDDGVDADVDLAVSQPNATATVATNARPSSPHQSQPKDEKALQSLALLLTFPRSSFVQTFDRVSKQAHTKKPQTRQSIRYDVFLNGDLNTCASQHPAHGSSLKREGTEAGTDLIRIVSGKRIEVSFERPWIFLQPDQTPTRGVMPDPPATLDKKEAIDTPMEALNVDETSSGQVVSSTHESDRWNSISRALRRYADEEGFNTWGERSPLGRYLSALADMAMPPQVVAMQQKCVHSFAIIDVVVSAGEAHKGNKGVGFLREPAMLSDPRYSPLDALSIPRLQPSAAPVPTAMATAAKAGEVISIPSSPKSSTDSDLPLMTLSQQRGDHKRKRSDVASEPHSPSQRAPEPKRRHPDRICADSSATVHQASGRRSNAALGSKTVTGYLGINKRGGFRRQAQSRSSTLSEPESPRSLPRTPLTIDKVSIMGRETPIIEKTLSSAYDLGLRRRLQQQNRRASHIHPLPESVVFGLRTFTGGKSVKQSDGMVTATRAPATPSPMSPLLPEGHSAAQQLPSSLAVRQNHLFTFKPATPIPEVTPKIQTTPSLRTRDRNRPTPLHLTRSTWKTPELSRGSVVTFAEEGKWQASAGGQGSVIRAIRSTKPGEFFQDQVLFAVRYIIAGGVQVQENHEQLGHVQLGRETEKDSVGTHGEGNQAVANEAELGSGDHEHSHAAAGDSANLGREDEPGKEILTEVPAQAHLESKATIVPQP